MKSNGRNACAFFFPSGLSWEDANAKCTALGARLPVILSEEENTDIANLAVCTSTVRSLTYAVNFRYHYILLLHSAACNTKLNNLLIVFQPFTGQDGFWEGVWLGATDTEREGTFVWSSTKERITYSN